MRNLAAVLIVILSAASVKASETCSIEIEGLLYHHGPCTFSETLGHDRYWSVDIGQKTDDETLGYWTLLLEQADGSYEGHWNGEYGATHAHNGLGTLRRDEHCWIGDLARICRGVKVGDTPSYRVLRGDGRPFLDNVLEASVNGIRYTIDPSGWTEVGPHQIGDTIDLDGDGFLETIIHLHNGGNAYQGWFGVISYRGDGFFHVVNEEPMLSGWHGFELVEVGSETLIRVQSQNIGTGNYTDHWTKTDYALRQGKLVRVVERVNQGTASGIASMTAEEVRRLDDEKKTLLLDLNLDGQKDEITCSYWDRWGTLTCDISFSGSDYKSDLVCKKLIVLPVVSDGALEIHCPRRCQQTVLVRGPEASSSPSASR